MGVGVQLHMAVFRQAARSQELDDKTGSGTHVSTVIPTWLLNKQCEMSFFR